MSFQKPNNKINIIIYGVNEYTEAIVNSIDKEKCTIIACIDYTNSYTNKVLQGIEIISGEQLFRGCYRYDYVVNGELSNFTVFDEMVNKGYVRNDNFLNYIKLLTFKSSISSSEFFLTYNNFIKSDKNFEGLITGLSYAQLSIDCSAFSKRFFNFASPSQDIFYDFEMLKYAYQYSEIKKNLKYVIIGLSYYSFEYDLSLSINSWRSCYYYPIVGSVHNFKEKDSYIYEYNYLNELGKSILCSDYAEIVCKCLEEYYIRLFQNSRKLRYDFQGMNNQEKTREVELILQDFDKNYPNTVEENKRILNDYLNYLVERKIVPIIVVSPYTRIYNLLVSKKMRDEFYEIINEFKKQHDFQFLDFANSEDFEDKHFTNASHMNEEGARRFTKILESKIEWNAMLRINNAQQEVVEHILNLFPTIDEAINHIQSQIDKLQIEDSQILFEDISQAINSITKSLGLILTDQDSNNNFDNVINLQQTISDVGNAFKKVDLTTAKSEIVTNLIPAYKVWKMRLEQRLKQQGNLLN